MDRREAMELLGLAEGFGVGEAERAYRSRRSAAEAAGGADAAERLRSLDEARRVLQSGARSTPAPLSETKRAYLPGRTPRGAVRERATNDCEVAPGTLLGG